MRSRAPVIQFEHLEERRLLAVHTVDFNNYAINSSYFNFLLRDSHTPTTGFSYTLGTGGTGLAAGGSVTTATNGYVDYLDANGNPLGGGATAPSNWSYQRTWLITDVSTTLKQITVKVTSRTSVGGPSVTPNSTVTSLKSNPF